MTCEGCGTAESCASHWNAGRKCCPDCTCQPVAADTTDRRHAWALYRLGMQRLCLRVQDLEKSAPDIEERLQRLEMPVDSRDAIVWEIGHAAGVRGEATQANPFRGGLGSREA